MLNGKDTITCFISEYVPKLKSWWEKSLFVSLCNKSRLKDAADVNTSDFAKKKTYLANLKFEVDNLDIDKVKNEPTNLSN